jgi:putative colanic acid biosynthesis acetyltransferase WcaF
VELSKYTNQGFDRGRPAWVEALWLLISTFFVKSWIPGSFHRVWLLRLFGAEIGSDVKIKPHVHIKFPWRMKLGSFVWIGEGVWIDNLADIDISDNCCISQGAYLCTGSHDWSSRMFELITKSIILKSYVWIGAKAVIAPGTVLGEGAVVAIGSVVSGELQPWSIYQGVPAKLVKRR